MFFLYILIEIYEKDSDLSTYHSRHSQFSSFRIGKAQRFRYEQTASFVSFR